MKSLHQFFTKPWLYLAIIIFGTFLKIYHFNYKLFWRDEIATVLYTSGVKESKYINDIPVNQIVSIKFVDSLLHNSRKPYSTKDEIKGILSDTHLTPAHYILLAVWYRIVGDDNMDYRLLSIFLSILSLPFIFFLAKSLFKSGLGGWITTSLYAVSPFINCQSQEARYYIVWVFFFVLSNCLFLLATKHNRILWWIAYAVASVLALYSSILSALFILGHLIYVLVCQKQLVTKLLVTHVCILAAYAPWLYFLYTVRHTIQSGMSWHTFEHTSIFSLEFLFFQMLGWSKSFTYFSDWVFYFLLFTGKISQELYVGLAVDIVILCLIFYSIRHLIYKSSKEVKWYLISIILPLFLFFYISDIIRNGLTSVVWRYQVVNMVGITIVVANLFTHKIKDGKIWFMVLYCGLIISGLISTIKIAEKRCWNTSPDCQSIINVAQVISQASYPLIITDLGGFGEYGFDNFLSTINESKSKNAEILYCKGAIPDIRKQLAGKAYSEIFVIQASDEFITTLKAQFGNNFFLYKKEDNAFYPQMIWKIKFEKADFSLSR